MEEVSTMTHCTLFEAAATRTSLVIVLGFVRCIERSHTSIGIHLTYTGGLDRSVSLLI